MRVLVDVNLSPKWAEFLATRGFEARHWTEVGPADAPDSAIMALAAEGEWIVLTNDLDFSAVLAWTRAAKPSVVQIRARLLTVAEIGHQVASALRMAEEDLERGALVTIDPRRSRVRILPLETAP